ncbi:MAG: hypothetical protein K9W44_15230 [Candidatus Lokiarchaeota archaeon]|nr:hypothetical protein [Candidatus Harpocratesius repetitus]
MTQYLHGQKGFVLGNVFAQSNKYYLKQASTFVRLVIIGRKNEMSWNIKARFQKRQLTEEETLNNLTGLFTTYRPWKNHVFLQQNS